MHRLDFTAINGAALRVLPTLLDRWARVEMPRPRALTMRLKEIVGEEFPRITALTHAVVASVDPERLKHRETGIKDTVRRARRKR